MAIPEPLTPVIGPVSIRALADQADALIRKHSIMTDEERTAIVLWSLSTYGYEVHRIFPRLAIISPLRRCGKSTLLEVLGALCKNVVSSSNLTPASLVRIKKVINPTLLIDEADTFIASADGDLKGILNGGHSKSNATVLRCQGDSHEMTPFDIWFPIAFASIGEVYDTLMDRSIVINLRRKKPDEKVARLHPGIQGVMLPWRRQVFTWFEQNGPAIIDQLVEPDFVGNDRAVDNWVPLFSLAAAISDVWLDRCDKAYRALTNGSDIELPVCLLIDINDILGTTGISKIGSTDLTQRLNDLDTSPWRSERLTAHKLSSMLSSFSIKPKNLRLGTKVLKGYEAADFADAFERYL